MLPPPAPSLLAQRLRSSPPVGALPFSATLEPGLDTSSVCTLHAEGALSTGMGVRDQHRCQDPLCVTWAEFLTFLNLSVLILKVQITAPTSPPGTREDQRM
jgi:hypothetical protein